MSTNSATGTQTLPRQHSELLYYLLSTTYSQKLLLGGGYLNCLLKPTLTWHREIWEKFFSF